MKFDTETRKLEGTPKDLPEAVWNMCKSADGKNLLIVDVPHGAGQAACIRTIDPSNLVETKKVSLQGPVANDIAPASGGQIAATVAAPAPNPGINVVLVIDNTVRPFDLGFNWKAAAKPGYVEYSPDSKLLFVSGYPALSGNHPPGLDVYEVTDADVPTGLKKKASIRTATNQKVGGHFFISPGGEYLVFQTGVVVATNDVGGNNGEGVPGGGTGIGGVGGGFVPPMPGANPGGGGFVPPPMPGVNPGGGGPPGGVVPMPPGGPGGGKPGGGRPGGGRPGGGKPGGPGGARPPM
jgi:hypothetical protein